MKHRIAAAITLGLALSNAAQAVYLNPRGLGQALIYPYYTVNANQSTLMSIVNTTPQGKALKVRFHEGYNGREVLGFNLYLSSYDVWTAEVMPVGDGAGIYTNDKSCTVPTVPTTAATAQPFLTYAYDGTALPSDTGPTGSDRTREGHFDVIEMGEVTNALHGSLNAITHVDGVPSDCAQVTSAWTADGYWVADPTVDLSPPGGGLYGSESIIDVAQGTIYMIDAAAIDGFSVAIQHSEPGAAAPDLNSANDGDFASIVTASVPLGSKMLAASYEHPVDAVSALFMADTLYNEYDIEPSIGAQSDWVVTFPTKRFYVDPTLNPAADSVSNPPFDEAFGTTQAGQSCSEFAPRGYDREEKPTLPPDPLCGVPPAQTPYAFCYEVNVLTFLTTQSVLGSGLLGDSSTVNLPTGFTSGHVAASLTEGMDGCYNIGAEPSHTLAPSINGSVLQGMPALGFLARSYINANVTAGVLANYSGLLTHRTSVTCMTNTDPPAACQ